MKAPERVSIPPSESWLSNQYLPAVQKTLFEFPIRHRDPRCIFTEFPRGRLALRGSMGASRSPFSRAPAREKRSLADFPAPPAEFPPPNRPERHFH